MDHDQGKNKQQQEHHAATSWCKDTSIKRPTTEKTSATALTRGRAGLPVTTWTSATAGSLSTARTQATAGRPTADNFKINTFSSCGTFGRVPNQFSEDWWFDTNLWAILFFSPQGRNFRWRSPNFQPLST
jgi:hypothetical protein